MDPSALKSAISYLQSTISAAQVQEATNFIPVIQEEKLKGLYPSYIHLNFHGGKKFVSGFLIRRSSGNDTVAKNYRVL